MITIEEGLVYHLKAAAAIIALVSDRVYPNKLPQTVAMPCITIQRISTPRVHSHDTSGATGTAYPRIQFDAWGTTYASCKAVTDAIRATINGYRGTMGAGATAVTVQGALVDDERYDNSPDTGLHRIMSDYIVWHLEG